MTSQKAAGMSLDVSQEDEEDLTLQKNSSRLCHDRGIGEGLMLSPFQAPREMLEVCLQPTPPNKVTHKDLPLIV